MGIAITLILKKKKNNMNFFVLSHSQKRGMWVWLISLASHTPFPLNFATPASLEISPTPPKKKKNLVYKKTMSILLKTSKRKILVVENKKKKKRGVLNPQKKKKKKKKKKK